MRTGSNKNNTTNGMKRMFNENKKAFNNLLIANLIKQYIIFNPGCTAKDISNFFMDYKFSFQVNCTPKKISALIRDYSNPSSNSAYKWFECIEQVKKSGKPHVYYVKGE